MYTEYEDLPWRVDRAEDYIAKLIVRVELLEKELEDRRRDLAWDLACSGEEN